MLSELGFRHARGFRASKLYPSGAQRSHRKPRAFVAVKYREADGHGMHMPPWEVLQRLGALALLLPLLLLLLLYYYHYYYYYLLLLLLLLLITITITSTCLSGVRLRGCCLLVDHGFPSATHYLNKPGSGLLACRPQERDSVRHGFKGHSQHPPICSWR